VTPGGLGRWLRTLRHLRPRQAAAQLRTRLGRGVVPCDVPGPPPRLGVAGALAPFLPGAEHARCDGWRRFRLLNREVEFRDRVDWDFAGEGPLWAYHLHQFEYARRPAASPRALAALLGDWIARHPSGIGWDPHPLSLRILSWSKLLLTPGALALPGPERAAVEASLARQVETLSRHLELHLGANHLFTNLLAVVWGGLLFSGRCADAWLAREGQLRRELAEQIGADGAHFERSPMYHALLLEQVLDLLNLARAAETRPAPRLVEALQDVSARMLGALEVWTHPDGEIALMADSAFGIAHPPRFLAAYASALGVEARPPARAGVLDAGGYVRLAAGPWSLLASVAGPSPPHQPGHSHCDALSIELCVGRERVVTDTGVAEYIPGALRDAARATRSHSTLQVDGCEQAEVWAAHRVGGRPAVTLERVEPGRRAEARCAGWSTPDTVHRRSFQVTGEAVELVDRLEGRARPVQLRLLLAPGLEPRLDAAGRVVQLRLASGRGLRMALPGTGALRWRVERAPYFPEFGRQLERAALVGEGESFREGSWRLELT
jgi:hypothetical protein